ncbi:uncharacterized protein V6R79_015649 [Siganus canaliculatus]
MQQRAAPLAARGTGSDTHEAGTLSTGKARKHKCKFIESSEQQPGCQAACEVCALSCRDAAAAQGWRAISSRFPVLNQCLFEVKGVVGAAMLRAT